MDEWQRRFIRYLFPYSARRLRIEQAFLAKHPHIPKRLYKFRSFSASHIDALREGVLWMSSPERFNDPFDTTVYFDPDRFLVEDLSLKEVSAEIEQLKAGTKSVEEIARRRIVHPIRSGELMDRFTAELFANETEHRRDKMLAIMKQINDERAQRLRQETSARLRSDFSVLSLAANAISILMWSHYANGHTGFSIEYDFGNLPPDDIRRRLCFPVLYRAKRTDATLYMAKGCVAGEFNNLFPQYLCLLKHSDWAYEQEWRIIFPTGATHANRQISMPKPNAIILGSRVASENEQFFRDYCSSRGIPIKRAVEIDGRFELKIENA
jgi:hypothetical protein